MLIVVVTAPAAIVGLIAVLPSSTRQMGNYATPLGAVAAVAGALLLVGVVSNTFLRHVVQNARQDHVTVIFNAFDELRRIAPSR